ncbi:MAG: vWA domain-containing protein [Bacillota bacterium]
MSLFDNLLAELEEEILSSAPAAPGAEAEAEAEAGHFRRLMATVPHGDVSSLVPAYEKLRGDMGRDFLALGLLAGGYPPGTPPFLTGRDHRVVVAAALLTYPEQCGPWWRTARALGTRQAVCLPVRNLLQVVRATREFRPRARRWVRRTVLQYLTALAADEAAWERQVLVDGHSLERLIRMVRAPVPERLMRPLRDRRCWTEWPVLSVARRFAAACREGGPEAGTQVLAEAEQRGVRLPLLFLEGVADVYRLELLPHVIPLMTGKQLLQRLSRLNEAGALVEGCGAWEAIARVLGRAAGDPRVAPADVRRARDLVAGLPPHVEVALARLEEARRAALPAGPVPGWAGREVCLVVDKSGSMEPAITAAGQLAAFLADQGARVTVVVFDSQARVLAPEVGSDGRPDWRATFRGIRAGGWTSIGAALQKAAEVAAGADLWVVLTDGACNTPPYAERNSPRPERGRAAVMWFNRNPSPGFAAWVRENRAEEFQPPVRAGRLDYAALDDLARLCGAGSALEEWLASVPSHVVAAIVRGEG